jgi:hypothetical protein
MPKSDKTIQNWNKRINEKDLVKKLGSPTKWDIFYEDETENEECPKENEFKDNEQIKKQNVLELENVKLNTFINQMQKIEKHKRRAMMKSNSLLTNDLRQPFSTESTKNKKRHGVIHSIKKMFKSDKSSAASRSSVSQQQTLLGKYAKSADNLDSYAENNLKHSNIYREESDITKSCSKKDVEMEREPGKQKQFNALEADDTDNNSLMIHIPINVQKIVLVRDGHKIKLEI